MAPIPSSLRAGLLPTEIEYFATSSTLVSIVPLLPIDRVRLLNGIFGPFHPPRQAKVPLWLAVNLKGKNKCRIVMPNWLTVETLTEIHKKETTSQRFAKVPIHYIAISKVLLDVASDDIPSSSHVRSLLKDIREVRQSKIINGLEMINSEHLEMTDISSLEIAELRPFFTKAFQHLSTLSLSAQAHSQSYSQGQNGMDEDQDQDQYSDPGDDHTERGDRDGRANLNGQDDFAGMDFGDDSLRSSRDESESLRIGEGSGSIRDGDGDGDGDGEGMDQDGGERERSGSIVRDVGGLGEDENSMDLF